MSRVVLDASAILAAIREEPGGEQIRAIARNAFVSAVNHAEVLTHLVRSGRRAETLRDLRAQIGYLVVAFDELQAIECSRLQRFTHHLKLSLSDRACLALGKLGGHDVLTADRAWTKLQIGVTIRAIR
jgi:PIN domain nuclease of toxin-antitoxin system